MNVTSNCDVTNSAHQIQMTNIGVWMKPLLWKCSAQARTFATEWFRIHWGHNHRITAAFIIHLPCLVVVHP